MMREFKLKINLNQDFYIQFNLKGKNLNCTRIKYEYNFDWLDF